MFGKSKPTEQIFKVTFGSIVSLRAAWDTRDIVFQNKIKWKAGAGLSDLGREDISGNRKLSIYSAPRLMGKFWIWNQVPRGHKGSWWWQLEAVSPSKQMMAWLATPVSMQRKGRPWIQTQRLYHQHGQEMVFLKLSPLHLKWEGYPLFRGSPFQ